MVNHTEMTQQHSAEQAHLGCIEDNITSLCSTCDRMGEYSLQSLGPDIQWIEPSLRSIVQQPTSAPCWQEGHSDPLMQQQSC